MRLLLPARRQWVALRSTWTSPSWPLFWHAAATTYDSRCSGRRRQWWRAAKSYRASTRSGRSRRSGGAWWSRLRFRDPLRSAYDSALCMASVTFYNKGSVAILNCRIRRRHAQSSARTSAERHRPRSVWWTLCDTRSRPPMTAATASATPLWSVYRRSHTLGACQRPVANWRPRARRCATHTPRTDRRYLEGRQTRVVTVDYFAFSAGVYDLGPVYVMDCGDKDLPAASVPALWSPYEIVVCE